MFVDVVNVYYVRYMRSSLKNLSNPCPFPCEGEGSWETGVASIKSPKWTHMGLAWTKVL